VGVNYGITTTPQRDMMGGRREKEKQEVRTKELFACPGKKWGPKVWGEPEQETDEQEKRVLRDLRNLYSQKNE